MRQACQDFDLGGGTPLFPVVVGAGDMNLGVMLDTVPPAGTYAIFAQNFTAGSYLSFFLDLTNNGPASPNPPDTFAFALASTGNVNLPTNDPFGTDYLLVIELTGGPLSPELYTTAGTNITPRIEEVPEPATGFAVAGLVFAMAGIKRFRRAS